MQNRWVTAAILTTMDADGKKGKVVEMLGLQLSTKKHTIMDLSGRAVALPQGGLCGLAALYQAMIDTVMTKSQLREAGYDDIREKITKEMLMSRSATKSWSDADLLMHYHDCKYWRNLL
jgi:hypothetical protein